MVVVFFVIAFRFVCCISTDSQHDLLGTILDISKCLTSWQDDADVPRFGTAVDSLHGNRAKVSRSRM